MFQRLIIQFKGQFFMKKLFIAVFVAVVCVSSAAVGQAKIAYVNSETILKELPEAQQAQKEIEMQVKIWQDEFERMGKQLQTEFEDYQKKQAMMDPASKAGKERAIQELQQKARDYQVEKFDTREGEAVKMREEKFRPIQDKVLDAIKVVAQEEGFSFVFDKIRDAAILLYADVKFDLTYKVLDRLKRGPAPKGKK